MDWKEHWIYRSGDVWLPKPIVKILGTYILGDDRSLVYLNYWHGIHFLSGVLFGLVQLIYPVSNPILYFIVLHTLWELWQIAIRMTLLNMRGCIDILLDTGMGLLGLLLVL